MKTSVKSILLILLMMILTTAGYSQNKYSSTKKSTYPQWSASPIGGVTIPVGTFGDNFKPGANVGVDISYKVNREVGFYGKAGYYFLTNKTQGLGDGKMMEYTVGPRYFFTAKNLKSSIFLEAGLGAYTIQQNSYTVNETVVPEVTNTNFGYNAGLGAILNLGKDVDMMFNVKYNSVLTDNGSTSFITPVLGVDFRF